MSYIDPRCMKKAIFHAADRKIYHFKHAKGAECTYKGEPESEEHLLQKKVIYGGCV